MTQNVKITEVICSMHHKIKIIEWMSHEINRIQSNYHIIGIYKKKKSFFVLLQWKKYTLEDDTVCCCILVSLLVNHTKIISLNIENLLWFSV